MFILQDWLCHYHNVHLLNLSTTPAPTHPFPPKVLMFLRSILSSNPSLGHALITSLSVHQLSNPQRYLMNNEALQLLYLDLANENVKKLREMYTSSSSKGEVGMYDSQYESDQHPASEALVPEKAEKLRDQVYQMLSLVNPYPEMNRAMKQVEGLFEQLLRPLTASEESGFSLGTVYSCLIGRSSCLLARKLQDMEESLRALAPASKTLLSGEVEEAEYWKSVFYRSFHLHEHFLEVVMVSVVGVCCVQFCYGSSIASVSICRHSAALVKTTLEFQLFLHEC